MSRDTIAMSDSIPEQVGAVQGASPKKAKSPRSHKKPQVMAPHPRGLQSSPQDLEADEDDPDSNDEDAVAQRNVLHQRRAQQDWSCTGEEKEAFDLRKKGLLGDADVAVDDATLTLDDLVPLHEDPGYAIQWTSPRKSHRQKRTSMDSEDAARQNLEGLSDGELASLMQACPELEIGSGGSTVHN